MSSPLASTSIAAAPSPRLSELSVGPDQTRLLQPRQLDPASSSSSLNLGGVDLGDSRAEARPQRPKRECRKRTKPIIDRLPGQLEDSDEAEGAVEQVASTRKASSPKAQGPPRSTEVLAFFMPRHRNFGATYFPFGSSPKIEADSSLPPKELSSKEKKRNGKGKKRARSKTPEL